MYDKFINKHNTRRLYICRCTVTVHVSKRQTLQIISLIRIRMESYLNRFSPIVPLFSLFFFCRATCVNFGIARPPPSSTTFSPGTTATTMTARTMSPSSPSASPQTRALNGPARPRPWGPLQPRPSRSTSSSGWARQSTP